MKHAPNCMIGRMEWQNTRMHEMGCTCGAVLRDTPERSGTAREAPSSEGPQGAARLPMTGDGAVVDHELAKNCAGFWQDYRNPVVRTEVVTGSLGNLARAYLAQAAEIEKYKAALRDAHEAGSKTHQLWVASDARTANLLKALEDFDNWLCGFNPEDRSSRMEGRKILIKARALMAAAKGETV